MKSSITLQQLQKFESRNVTHIDASVGWPIVWERAQGCTVWDANSREYLDLTGAFGVAAAGHANPRVVKAGQRQMGQLLHAMGDVHPHALKAQLARELSALTFERWEAMGKVKRKTPRARARHGKVTFGSSGFEAVEAALKTARLATGKSGVIAFTGGYHGLGYGALNTTHRDHFREPFRDQLREFGTFLPFPECGTLACHCELPSRCDPLADLERTLRAALSADRIGAILVEPIQTRGGIRIPHPSFLPLLRRVASETGTLLILDEIYTGFGRTGRWFACEHQGVVPDLICIGKALTGGFPLSACIGRAEVMDAWPVSDGEAIHTSTFLGHPVGCAMALAQIRELQQRKLVERSAHLGRKLAGWMASWPSRLGDLQVRFRGLGLMAGLELASLDGSPATTASLSAVQEMLRHGFIVLPEGAHAEVIGLTPPLTIGERDLRRAITTLREILEGRSSVDLGRPGSGRPTRRSQRRRPHPKRS